MEIVIVSIQPSDEVAAGVKDGEIPVGAHSEVAFSIDCPDVRMVVAERVYESPGTIRGRVVSYDDFVDRASLLNDA